MLDGSGMGDERTGGTPPPAADDRLWRHPSEIAAAMRAASSPPAGHTAGHTARATAHPGRHHRLSIGTVVVAGSLGALAMFGTLAAMGLVSGVTPPVGGDGDDASRAGVTGPPSSVVARVDGVVTVRITTAGSTTYGAGLVLNGRGDIVSTVETDTGAVVALETGDAAWSAAEVVGDDPVTGLVVLRPKGLPAAGTTVSSTSPTSAAGVTRADLGADVRMFRAGTTAVGAGVNTATRITSTNACLDHDEDVRVGLLTLTSARRTGPTEVAVDPATSTVVGLVVPDDDNPEDQMQYAVPADVAQRVGRQIVDRGFAVHGSLALDLRSSDDDTLTVTAVDPAGPAAGGGVSAGDELLSVDGRPVHSSNDVAGALLGRTPGSTVSIVVRRDNRRQSMVLPVAEALVPMGVPLSSTMASSTTLP